MDTCKGKVIKSGRDAKGRARKFIEIPGLYYEDFEFGDMVIITKIRKYESEQES